MRREGADQADDDLERFGALTGAREMIELGFQANEYEPKLYTHDRFIEELGCELRDQENIEYRCRRIVEHMALAFQGSLLVRSGDGAVAEAHWASRLTKIDTCGTYGALRAGLDCRRIIQRATPQQSA